MDSTIINYLSQHDGKFDKQIAATLYGNFMNATEDDLNRILNNLPEYLVRKPGFVFNTNIIKLEE